MQPTYIGDIDQIMRRMSAQVPIIDSDILYLDEMGIQEKIYLATTVLGLLMLLFAILL